MIGICLRLKISHLSIRSDMWPFALLSIGVIPFMGFATALEMKRFLGEDEGSEVVEDGCDSPGGIIVETLLNIRTVSALTLEEQRLDDYEKALAKAEGNVLSDSAVSGALSGLSIAIQQVSCYMGMYQTALFNLHFTENSVWNSVQHQNKVGKCFTVLVGRVAHIQLPRKI